MTGQRPNAWRSSRLVAIHDWLRCHYPKTGVCEHCGSTGRRTVFAYLHHPQPYTRNRGDYLELCYGCHVRFDFANGTRKQPRLTHCKRGHQFDETNTYTRPSGLRSCRPCLMEAQRQRRSRQREQAHT